MLTVIHPKFQINGNQIIWRRQGEKFICTFKIHQNNGQSHPSKAQIISYLSGVTGILNDGKFYYLGPSVPENELITLESMNLARQPGQKKLSRIQSEKNLSTSQEKFEPVVASASDAGEPKSKLPIIAEHFLTIKADINERKELAEIVSFFVPDSFEWRDTGAHLVDFSSSFNAEAKKTKCPFFKTYMDYGLSIDPSIPSTLKCNQITHLARILKIIKNHWDALKAKKPDYLLIEDEVKRYFTKTLIKAMVNCSKYEQNSVSVSIKDLIDNKITDLNYFLNQEERTALTDNEINALLQKMREKIKNKQELVSKRELAKKETPSEEEIRLNDSINTHQKIIWNGILPLLKLACQTSAHLIQTELDGYKQYVKPVIEAEATGKIQLSNQKIEHVARANGYCSLKSSIDKVIDTYFIEKSFLPFFINNNDGLKNYLESIKKYLLKKIKSGIILSNKDWHGQLVHCADEHFYLPNSIIELLDSMLEKYTQKQTRIKSGSSNFEFKKEFLDTLSNDATNLLNEKLNFVPSLERSNSLARLPSIFDKIRATETIKKHHTRPKSMALS